MSIFFGLSLMITGCGSSGEGDADSGTEPAVDLGPEPEPDQGPSPDLGSPCPATCPSLGQSECNPTNPPGTCGLCLWRCTTVGDCPGGTVSTDGGEVGACYTCDEGNICVPLETTDPSCTVGLIGHPCGSSNACEAGSVCASITGWVRGLCAPDCEL